MDASPLGPARDELGESPVWLPGPGLLQRVDIRGRRILRTDPATLRTAVHGVADDVGFALPTTSGGLLAGCGRTIVRVEEFGAAADPIASVEPDRPGNRFNDAKADAAGRVWAGTMSVARERGAAALYRLEPGGRPDPVLTGATISNGLDWNEDATVMYYVDSTTQQIDAISFDLDRGVLGRRRRFAAIAAEDGLPDGLTVDAEGGVWIALFGGGRLRRYLPSGTPDAEVRLPVTNPTSPAFGGDDLATLFVTSARHRLSASQLAAEPLAGAVLTLRPGLAGRPANEAGL